MSKRKGLVSGRKGEPAGSMLPMPLPFLAAWLAVWLGRVLQHEVDYLLAKQGVLGDQRSARANEVGEDTEDGLRDLTKHGRESIRYQAPVDAVRRLASNRSFPAWDIIPGLITWHLPQPEELERAPGPHPASVRTEFFDRQWLGRVITESHPLVPLADQPSSSEPTRKGHHVLPFSIRTWPHWHVAFYVAVMLGSLGLFLRYLVRNLGANQGDEAYYVIVADRILKGGLFGFREELRTYLYPLLLSFAQVLFGKSPVCKAFVGLLQYAVFLYSLRIIAATAVKLTGRRAGGLLVFAAGALNPYLVQATTLFLTDILAACLVACGFAKLLFGNLSATKDCLSATLPFAAAVMVRPASAVFLPIACLGLAVRRYVEPIHIRKVILGFVLSSAFFVPQLYMNVTQFKHWTPIIHSSLYRLQTHEAVRCLKYGTVIIPGEIAPLCFTNPLADKSCDSMGALAMKSPLAFSVTAAAHVFGVIDWGYIDTYITNYYPSDRFPASLLLHTTWFLVALGFARFLRQRRILPAKTSAMLLFLVAAIVLDLGFLATTQVESRFGYPVLLMALPFLGFSFADLRLSAKAAAGIVVSWLFWLALSTFLSLWIDGMSGRIHWFARFT